jgi:adenylyl-sulfate kinase
MVIWIIGLSGAGKTTLANEIATQIRNGGTCAVLLDGDVVREVFGNDIGYSMEDRLVNAKRICQLGKFIENEGIHVICPILSLFPETRDWNRKNLKNYYEVFIETPMEHLIQRDSKGLYSKFKKGEISEVAGMDLEFKRPEEADLIINNVKSKEEFLNFAPLIVQKVLNS